jgi:hypothetical protein
MSDYIREAFDSDDVVQKNLALRRAYGELEFLRGGGCANDDIKRLSVENESLLDVIQCFVDAYANANPIRQADWHTKNCNCLRCAFDNACAALAEQEKK